MGKGLSAEDREFAEQLKEDCEKQQECENCKHLKHCIRLNLCLEDD